MAFFLKEHHYWQMGNLLRDERGTEALYLDVMYLFGCVRLVSDYCAYIGHSAFSEQAIREKLLYTDAHETLLRDPIKECVRLVGAWRVIGDTRIASVFDVPLSIKGHSDQNATERANIAQLSKLFFPKKNPHTHHGITISEIEQGVDYFFEFLSKGRFLFFGDKAGWGNSDALNQRFTSLTQKNFNTSFNNIVTALLAPNASRWVFPLAMDIPMSLDASHPQPLLVQPLHVFSKAYLALKCLFSNTLPEMLDADCEWDDYRSGDAVFLDVSLLENQNWLPQTGDSRAQSTDGSQGTRRSVSERHIPRLLSSLKPHSKALVLTHSSIGSRALRKQLVESRYLDAVIHLPRGLIQAGWRCVLLLLNTDKATDEVYFYDASEDGETQGRQVQLDDVAATTLIQYITEKIVVDSLYDGQSIIVHEKVLAGHDYLLEVHRYLKPRTAFDAEEVDMREVALERQALTHELYHVTERFRETERHLLDSFSDCPEFDRWLRGETPL